MLSSKCFQKFQNRKLINISSFKTAPFQKKLACANDLWRLLLDVHEHGKSYGFHTNYFKTLKPENIVVEFSSPNIAKLFHIGHYRSTVIGNAISNVLTASGHNVCKMNYLGDWGIQFALLAVAYKMYGNEKLLNSDPLKHLFDLYVKISSQVKVCSDIYDEAQQLFLEMEKGNENNLQFWKRCRDLSVQEYKKLYEETGIKFDVYSGESMYVDASKRVVEQLKVTGCVACDDAFKADLTGSSWFSETETRHCHPVIARSNGTTLYLSRDVAAALDRYERYNFDRMIYVTDESQAVHFKQVFGILEKLGCDWAKNDDNRKVFHKSFGRVQKMQTRKGNVVFLNDILEEAYQRAYEDRRGCETRKADLDDYEITKTLAKSGLICYDLKSSLKKGYKFSWESALASKGNSGMYLQYTYSRLCSLEKYSGVDLSTNIDPDRILTEEHLVAMLNHVQKYTEVTEQVYETLEPNHIVYYLYALSRLISKALTNCYVKGKPLNDAQARLFCFHCAKIVLGNGLTLLGISPLEQH